MNNLTIWLHRSLLHLAVLACRYVTVAVRHTRLCAVCVNYIDLVALGCHGGLTQGAKARDLGV